MSIVASKATAAAIRQHVRILTRNQQQSNAILVRSFQSSRALSKPKKHAPSPPPPPPKKKSPPPPPPKKEPIKNMDPHAMAAELIQKSPSSQRIPGTESLALLSTKQKMQNYVTAGALIAFVTSVWYYSMTAVGKASSQGDDEDGLHDLEVEAMDARDDADVRDKERKEAEKLVQLERAVVELEKEESGGELVTVEEDVGELLLLQGVSSEEHPTEAEVFGGGEVVVLVEKNVDGGSRPLWKKIVFFWRRQ